MSDFKAKMYQIQFELRTNESKRHAMLDKVMSLNFDVATAALLQLLRRGETGFNIDRLRYRM